LFVHDRDGFCLFAQNGSGTVRMVNFVMISWVLFLGFTE
jgi:hypothetical protein